MSDDQQQVNQVERALFDEMNKARRAQTSWLLGFAIDDGLREHEERLAAEADNDNDEEKA